MSSVVLYHYFRSSASWRVRTALAMKNIPYEHHFVNILKDEQAKDDFKAVNSLGQVPALFIDGVTLTQSLPIIEYLEETRPSTGQPLLPKDPKARAKARAIAETVNSGIQPIQNLPVLNRITENKQEWASYWISKGFDALEVELKECAGSCCVGDELSIADICLVPQVYNAYRFGVDMSKYPIIDGLYKRLSELEPFQLAHPFKQPDCPEDLRQ